MNIAGVEIGNGHPCRVSVDLSNNHNGDFDRAIRLLSAIKKAGADFAKFQCYTPDELVELRGDGPAPDPWGSEGWTMRDLYEKAQTPHAWFPDLVAHCEEIGLPWFSSVFGAESLALLESLGCPAYKIAALDVGDIGLGGMVASATKPVIVSQRAALPYPADYVLYCPEGYPQPGPFDHETLDVFDKFDGFSYHGTRPYIPVLAAQMGAKIVEVHVHLKDEPSELEANVSLNEVQLAAVCAEVKL